ncbi:MAG: amidohydrolase family protein [Verrucomicrobia bacterium]|nr:amidohydrolase family protein [Verrucomicrobiota bacterium]
MKTQQPCRRAAGGWRRPVLAAVVTHLLTLGIGSALLVGATFGLAKAYAVLGLLWLGTIGLPTTLGVAGVAAVWGCVPLLSGMAGFCVVAALTGLALQVLVFILAWRWLRSRERSIPASTWRRGVAAGVILLSLAAVGLWITQPRPTDPAVVIDAHAHLFGDTGWPPRHNLSCGLSPSQKANRSYLTLTRLLGLPKSGDLDEAYIQALVNQVRETRKVIPRFRVVLLAQDCRYTPQGDPDWVNSTAYVPNEHLFRVVRRYPDLFIPCPSINPQRKDWEAELAYCVAQGARVLKIHPPTQAVDPSEPRFRAFYRKCGQNDVRIMVHTGTEHSAPIASQRLGDPRLLDLALSEGCTVVAAHSATRAFFDPPAEDYFRFLVEMMRGQPRLYGDTAVLGSLPRWRCLPDILSSPAARPRTLHGSDWPFPANALVFWNRLHPLTLLDLMAEKNLFLRDFRLKQALGLPQESFTLAADLLAVDRDPKFPGGQAGLR